MAIHPQKELLPQSHPNPGLLIILATFSLSRQEFVERGRRRRKKKKENYENEKKSKAGIILLY